MTLLSGSWSVANYRRYESSSWQASTSMSELWATMLPAAIAIAVSPTGIIEMMLVVLSARARVNAFVFLASVMVSVFLLPLLGASILRAMVDSHPRATSASAANAWVLMGFGTLLIVFAVGNFAKRADATHPAVLDKIVGMGPAAVFLLSLTVMWVNPINALVLLSVGSQAALTGVSTATLLMSLVVFTVLATVPFIAVVALLVSGGERASATLEKLRQRLLDHNRIIMAVVLGLLGLLLLAQGVASLPG